MAGRPEFDCCAALVAVVAAVQTVVTAFVYDGAYASLAGAAGLLLTVNRAAKLKQKKMRQNIITIRMSKLLLQ